MDSSNYHFDDLCQVLLTEANFRQIFAFFFMLRVTLLSIIPEKILPDFFSSYGFF